MMSGTLSSLAFLTLSCSFALAQEQVQFNQVLNINGDMELNSFQFPDRSKIETFSQKQQQLIVNQQEPAIPANQVTGTTGQPFVAISPQAMVISTNGATDLVGAQIQMAMSQQLLQQVAVQPDNTYVAKLSPDRQTWMIQETMRSINTTDMTVRMVKVAQLDGEYMIVGRRTIETNTLVVPFGTDAASSVAIAGTGLQENEFQDGFRMSTRSSQPMTMNVNVKDGIDGSMLAALQGQEPVNDYRYSVVTNLAAVSPDLNQQVTVVQMPINVVRIQKMMQAMGVPPTGSVSIAVAQRGVLQNPGGATGNLGGAAAARRGITRDLFRKEIRRQVQAGQEQAAAPAAAPPAAAPPAATQPEATQPQAAPPAAAPPAAGQPEAAPPAAAPSAAAQPQAGQEQTGQQQAGTPTNGNNPVAAQLLLEPTFTPIQANAILDQTNMRIAFPVRQVDGEYILTMQVSGGGGGVRPVEGQNQGQNQEQPAPAAAENPRPSESPKPSAEGERPTTQGAEQPNNGTESAQPQRQRRQEAGKDAGKDKDKYGDAVASPGAVIMSMKMVDQMVASSQWGGQAPITQMMSEYVKAQTGREMAPMNGTAA